MLLVLDAAYAEYVRRNDYEAGIELVATTPNTVMTRTFSKIHGLAGLRLGWAYCPETVADVLNRIRGPFNVSAPALAAGVAAITDQAHEEAAAAHNEEWRPRLAAGIEKLGLKVTPSVANFLLVHFPKDTKRNAPAADAFLKSRGIIVRRVDAYGLPEALRITIGTGIRQRGGAGGAFAISCRAPPHEPLCQRNKVCPKRNSARSRLSASASSAPRSATRRAAKALARLDHGQRAHQGDGRYCAEARPHRQGLWKCS